MNTLNFQSVLIWEFLRRITTARRLMFDLLQVQGPFFPYLFLHLCINSLRNGRIFFCAVCLVTNISPLYGNFIHVLKVISYCLGDPLGKWAEGHMPVCHCPRACN